MYVIGDDDKHEMSQQQQQPNNEDSSVIQFIHPAISDPRGLQIISSIVTKKILFYRCTLCNKDFAGENAKKRFVRHARRNLHVSAVAVAIHNQQTESSANYVKGHLPAAAAADPQILQTDESKKRPKRKLSKVIDIKDQEKVNDNNENINSGILQLFSSMFRQHADLYLQEAAVLEKMALFPEEPHLWFESSPNNQAHSSTPSLETIDNRILRNNVYKLAKKSFDCMEEMKKEMDLLQDLVENAMQQELDLSDNEDDGSSDMSVESMDILNYKSIIQNEPIDMITRPEDKKHRLHKDNVLHTNHVEKRSKDTPVLRSRDRDELGSDDEDTIIPI